LWEEYLEPAVAFGRVLRQIRQEAGLTQEGLGFEAELRRTYVSILELGQQQPSLTTILKLAKALNKTGSEFIGMVETEMTSKNRRR
jgi:transcriptional regulator with XRE-family HTH domain